MSLKDDADGILTRIERLAGKEKTEAFVAAMRDPAAGDRLPAVLQFLADESFSDEVIIAVVLSLADPAFYAATATLEEIQGIAYLLKGAVEVEYAGDAVALQGMRPRAAEEFAALQAKREKRMQKQQLLAHMATKCGIPEKAVEAVLNELSELAVQETNAHDAFNIPGIGTLVKLVREERMGRNPQTGEPVPIPAKTVVKFRLESKLKSMCGDSSADPLPSS
jgi:DNA-binding protein HU-beta